MIYYYAYYDHYCYYGFDFANDYAYGDYDDDLLLLLLFNYCYYFDFYDDDDGDYCYDCIRVVLLLFLHLRCTFF